MGEVEGLLARMYDDAKDGLRRRRRRRLGFGSEVCIRADDGTLLRLQEGTNHLVGGEHVVDRAARFHLVRVSVPFASRPKGTVRYGDVIALRSVKTNKFVRADFGNGRVLTCEPGQVRAWESFTLHAGESRPAGRRGVVSFGSEVALGVNARWHGDEDWFVQYRRETSKLSRARVQHVEQWETFVLLRPAELR